MASLGFTVDGAVNSGAVRNVYPIFKVVLGRSDEKSPAVTELVALGSCDLAS